MATDQEEKSRELHALWLFVTSPEQFTSFGFPIRKNMTPSEFLEKLRSGNIRLAPLPDEGIDINKLMADKGREIEAFQQAGIIEKQRKHVRVPVLVHPGTARLVFILPENHPCKLRCRYGIEQAPSFGGSVVYHLPNGDEVVTAQIPLFLENGTGRRLTFPLNRSEETMKKIWPKEIEFDPYFLK